MSKKSIGVFDSGFGGIGILRGIVKKMPEYDYIYLGDTARNPYGTRSQETIYEFTKQAVDFLFAQNCELIIFACNTVSAGALRRIQQEYLPTKYPGKNVLGVLKPASESAVEMTKNNCIGVIATEATVRSQAFETQLKIEKPGVKVFQKATNLLVPIVEALEKHPKATELILTQYLKPLIAKKIDTLILGCTHYGFLEKQIRKIVGPKIKIVSEEKIIPGKLRNYLKRHTEMDAKLLKGGTVTFYSTDLTDKFRILGSKFFGKKIAVKKASLI